MRAAGAVKGGQSAVDRVALPAIAWLAIAAMLLPMNFNIGPINLTLSRVIFLFLVPILLVNLARGAYGSIVLADVLVVFQVLWLVVSLSKNNPDVVVTFAGQNAVAILGGYLAARATIRSPAHFAALCRALVWVVVFSIPFALIETLTARVPLREILDAIPGMRVGGKGTHEQRMGLYRVQFLFAHPIHYGFFCSLIFSLAFVGLRVQLSRFKRMAGSFLIGTACFLSLSSGAVLALAVQIFLIGWAWVTRKVKSKWPLLFSLTGAFYLIVEILSDRPAIIAILSRLAFNSGTVSVRQTIFTFGSEQIARTPIFGVGFNDWGVPPWMSGSVDNFWLLQGLVYGLPALFAIAGAFIFTMIRVGRRDFSRDEALSDLRLAWLFTMTSMMLTLATVAVWGSIHSFVMFVFGSGVFLLTAKPADGAEAVAQPAEETRRLRYSRFGAEPAAAAAVEAPKAEEREGPVLRRNVTGRRSRTDPSGDLAQG